MEGGDGAIILTFSWPRRDWEQRPVQRGSSRELLRNITPHKPPECRAAETSGRHRSRSPSPILRLRGGLQRPVGAAMQGSDDNPERHRFEPGLLRCSMAWHLGGRLDVLAREVSSWLGRPWPLSRSARSCSSGGVDVIIGTYTGRVPRVWMVLGYLGSHGVHV